MKILEIAKEYNVNVYFVVDGDDRCIANGRNVYINQSYCCGKNIEIGLFEDKELESISFFHELGHVIDPIDWSKVGFSTKWHQESSAWYEAIKLMNKYGFSITEKSKLWMLEQLNTYINS